MKNLMIGNLVVYPNYYKNNIRPDRYFIVKEILEDNRISISDSFVATIIDLQEQNKVKITIELLEKLNVIEHLLQVSKSIFLVYANEAINILVNGNYHGTVQYFHELQNYLLVNFKIVINLDNLYVKLNK